MLRTNLKELSVNVNESDYLNHSHDVVIASIIYLSFCNQVFFSFCILRLFFCKRKKKRNRFFVLRDEKKKRVERADVVDGDEILKQ